MTDPGMIEILPVEDNPRGMELIIRALPQTRMLEQIPGRLTASFGLEASAGLRPASRARGRVARSN